MEKCHIGAFSVWPIQNRNSPHTNRSAEKNAEYQWRSLDGDTIIASAYKWLIQCVLSQNSSDPATIDQLMSSLDANNDGELTFLEFWQLIGNVANQHGGF